MASQSPHLTDIPQAIRIAASTDAVDPALKQQALDYLTKVKELCEETWQVGGNSISAAEWTRGVDTHSHFEER